MSNMFQKNPNASIEHPIAGTPGCVFLKAGMANNILPETMMRGNSGALSFSQKKDATPKIDNEISHIMIKMKIEKAFVDIDRENTEYA